MERFLSYVTEKIAGGAWYSLEIPKIKGPYPVMVTIINGYSRNANAYIYHELKLRTGSSLIAIKDHKSDGNIVGMHFSGHLILMPGESIVYTASSNAAITATLTVMGYYLND